MKVKEIYCLKWLQTGRITIPKGCTSPEGYTSRKKAQRLMNHNNRNISAFQKLIRRRWVIETIRVIEGD